MEIIDLEEKYEKTFCNCLEDWSDELSDAGDLKKQWIDKKKGEGLRVKLARNDSNQIVGMVQYIPIEHSWVSGEGLYFIYCIWVHGYKEGVGNNQGQGTGSELLSAAEEDCRELGAAGIAAWGVRLPFFMRSKWFKKRGYKKADSDGMMELVWKPFNSTAIPPELVKQKKRPEPGVDKPVITCFRNGWCPAQNVSCEKMKRAAAELGDELRLVELNTDDPDVLAEWGIADAVFINSKRITNGPPLTDERIRKQLKKALGRYR